MKYEVIVVGGGHAGCEAALAPARKGHKTLLVTGNKQNIADMPCNPSIGGPAKGTVVREIDALGGEMGKNADKTILQIKKLNTKKGPAVQTLRAQIDKVQYRKEMIKTIEEQDNLDIYESIVEDLIIKDNKIEGVILEDKTKILAKSVILTTGTYLKGRVLIGFNARSEGPSGEKPSLYLSDNLKKLGFRIQRLKTGTPARIEKSSIDFSKAQIQPGDDKYLSFSFENKYQYDVKNQKNCYLLYTNKETHKIINKNMGKSSMYGGVIEGIGPRYCPSIETKLVRFSDKDRHQLFLEPESLSYDDIYLQGFSTSMPEDIQEIMVHSLEGLENAKILKYAYAIEYDAIDPLQVQQSLETKIIENLYTAGQINGTSGYEEAAGQGLIAGINASLKLEGKEPLILKRNEAYIGVLIDDLVTKGTKEPYRLLTSRAEYRLLLRDDNANLRLTQYGRDAGLVKDKDYEKYINNKKQIKELKKELKEVALTPTEENNYQLGKMQTNPINKKQTLEQLLKRPEMKITMLRNFLTKQYDEEIESQVETMIKYEGYIKKQQKEAEKMLKYENIKIPKEINYNNVSNLALEAREKLLDVMPTSVGQALRISGVNPSDISILMIYIKKEEK